MRSYASLPPVQANTTTIGVGGAMNEKSVSFLPGNQPPRPHAFGDIRRISSDKIVEDESILKAKMSDPPSFHDWFDMDGLTGPPTLQLPLDSFNSAGSGNSGGALKIPSWGGGDDNNSGRSLGGGNAGKHELVTGSSTSDLFHPSPPPLHEDDLDYGLFNNSSDVLDMQIV